MAWRQIGVETIVVDLEAKEMFGLSPSAGRLWQDLDQLGLELSQCDQDRRALIEQLVELGLVKPADSSGEVSPQLFEQHSAEEELAVVWREALEQVAATCAFLPGQSALCNTAPFS